MMILSNVKNDMIALFLSPSCSADIKPGSNSMTDPFSITFSKKSLSSKFMFYRMM